MARRHQLHRHTRIPVETSKAFAFFCDPRNLQKITPPELDFSLQSEPVGPMGPDVEIGYRMRLWGVPIRWRSRILDWVEGREFVDTALVSPYRHWHHRHILIPDGAWTTMLDLVDYELPLWPVGELAHGIVRRQLERIFDFRERAIQAEFRAGFDEAIRQPKADSRAA